MFAPRLLVSSDLVARGRPARPVSPFRWCTQSDIGRSGHRHGTLASARSPARDRPVTVHSRDAERQTIERLASASARAILHSYTGPLAAAEDALATGLSY